MELNTRLQNCEICHVEAEGHSAADPDAIDQVVMDPHPELAATLVQAQQEQAEGPTEPNWDEEETAVIINGDAPVAVDESTPDQD